MKPEIKKASKKEYGNAMQSGSSAEVYVDCLRGGLMYNGIFYFIGAYEGKLEYLSYIPKKSGVKK